MLAPRQSMWGNPRNLVMHLGRIKLPNASAAPNDLYFAGTQFYWDSYFTILGLISSGKKDAAKAMVDNLAYLFGKFGLIPARNSWTSLGRSQPPFLTSMVYEVYRSKAAGKDWLDRMMNIAMTEYERVWINGQRLDKKTHLSKYQPKYFKRWLTVYESGWDISSRFKSGHHNILPVDLNCLLYKYEADFLKWSKMNNNKVAIKRWRQALNKRRKLINKYFWNQDEGFFYDFNLQKSEQEKLKTLAGFFPLWCGVASRDQARACQKQLGVFEFEYGLASSEPLPTSLKQWDYPNGWAPLQFLVYEGLKKSGFKNDAVRVAKKWLECNETVFAKTNQLWEKYDVVKGDVGKRGRYPTQPGFAWTNGVFVRLAKELKAGKKEDLVTR